MHSCGESQLSCGPAASSEQAKITSTRNGVLSGGHIELSENALDMRFDGVERDVELVADLPLREVGPEQPEHGGSRSLSSTAYGKSDLGRALRRSSRSAFTTSWGRMPGSTQAWSTSCALFNSSVQPCLSPCAALSLAYAVSP